MIVPIAVKNSAGGMAVISLTILLLCIQDRTNLSLQYPLLVAHLVGTQEMDMQTFIEKVVSFAGNGVVIELEPKLVADLRSLLNDWKRVR